MDERRILTALLAALLGILGFSSCSHHLLKERNPIPPMEPIVKDTIPVVRRDTTIGKVKLMYGVPPARYRTMEIAPKEEQNEI